MNNRAKVSSWMLGGLILLGLVMCAASTAFSFFVGRETAMPQMRTEIVEVTREVVVVEQIALEAATEAEAAPTAAATELPPAEPTEVPAAEPTAIPPVAPGLDGAELPGASETLAAVWDLLREQYDGEVPANEELLEGAIQGSVEALGDRYTRYVPADVAIHRREARGGNYEGIGAYVGLNDEGLFYIVRPMDGLPADQAGLKAGDVIVAVDGVMVIGMGLDEIIELVKGPGGTEVVLTVRREGLEEFDVTVVREHIEIPFVEHEILPEQIAYLRLTSFSSIAEEQMLAALEEMMAQEPQGLILDLRDNPGGLLDQALAVSDLFLESGIILYERNGNGFDRTFQASGGQPYEAIPMVVLVNAGSASAAEIVAGALQANGRAILVGETTFGKGSVQRVNELPDGSELYITSARWYTPNNESIDGEGIEPDIIVETPEDLGGETDTQIQRAVAYLSDGE